MSRLTPRYAPPRYVRPEQLRAAWRAWQWPAPARLTDAERARLEALRRRVALGRIEP